MMVYEGVVPDHDYLEGAASHTHTNFSQRLGGVGRSHEKSCAGGGLIHTDLWSVCMSTRGANTYRSMTYR